MTLSGTRCVRGTTTLSRLKPRITPFPVCSFVISVPPCDARCKRLRHGGEPLCAQERREALVGQEVLHRLDHEEKPRLREVRLARRSEERREGQESGRQGRSRRSRFP